MKLIKKFATSLALISALMGCGGGGSGGGTVSAPVAVASTSAFNLSAAYQTQASSPSSNNFSVSGTISGYPITGSGTATNGAMSSGLFEGVSAFYRTNTVTGIVVANGTSIPLASSSTSWTDTNYLPFGEMTGSEYIVVQGTPTIPTAARVSHTGPIYTANRYTNSGKATMNGTIVVTYVVEADTASTVLVTIISAYKDMLGATTKTGTVQMRVSTSNQFARVKETLLDTANGINMTINY